MNKFIKHLNAKCLSLCLFACFSIVHSAIASADTVEVISELGGVGHDFAIDSQRNQVYVSLGTNNEVAIVSMDSWQVTERVFVGSAPRGLDLSDDGATLYIALNGSGSIAALDIDSGVVEEIVLATLLDDPRTWDVMEGPPGEVFISSSPGSNGFAYIVRVDRNNDNAASRVASNQIIRASPTFVYDPEGEFMYVGSGFSPNSLYKLDASQSSAPIVLEDDHGSVSGTTVSLTLNEDGSRIYTGSGQRLRTGSFTQDGFIGSGPSTLSLDGSEAIVMNTGLFGSDELVIDSYSTETFLQTDSFLAENCVYNNATKEVIKALPNEEGYVLLGADLLCVYTTRPPRALEMLPNMGRFLSTQIFDVGMVLRSDGLDIVELLEISVDGVANPNMSAQCFPGNLDTGESTFHCAAIGRGIAKAGSATQQLVTVKATVLLSDGESLSGEATYEFLDVIESAPSIGPSSGLDDNSIEN